jgi:hypothetical protein
MLRRSLARSAWVRKIEVIVAVTAADVARHDKRRNKRSRILRWQRRSQISSADSSGISLNFCRVEVAAIGSHLPPV